MDESIFGKRKYIRGNQVNGHWVFGGIQRGTSKCFMVKVPDTKRKTLEAEFQRFILPGSHILSDGWAAYARIDQINDGIYTDEVITHNENFVHPDDSEIHTQNIEGMWSHAKHKLQYTHGTMVGGTDPITGEAIVAEIDESIFGKRKYIRGNQVNGHWVFGGIQRGTSKCFMWLEVRTPLREKRSSWRSTNPYLVKESTFVAIKSMAIGCLVEYKDGTSKCFMVKVPDRKRTTLEAEIQRFILPGSHILSDGWAVYARIDQINDGIYTDEVITHNENFVHPDDSEIHTQNIEGMWSHAKHKLRYTHGTSEVLFETYLTEFVWKNHFF
ncbi:hypothetical protein GQR58_022514 [Nymphon striatum]|nr:hypothetical protein GQR58_022514 [Nymphon striatum]